MSALILEPEVEQVVRSFFTCEFTTLNSQGQPLTWPCEPFYHAAAGRIIVSTSIAYPVKAYNARRTPRVGLLFSDPTGTGLSDPPAVLVQGDATVEELAVYPPWAFEMFKESVERQPNMRRFVQNSVARRLFRFEFQRMAITVRPCRILVWAHGDFRQAPRESEVRYVE